MKQKTQNWIHLDNTEISNLDIHGNLSGLIFTSEAIETTTQLAQMNHLFAHLKSGFVSIPYSSQLNSIQLENFNVLFSVLVAEQELSLGHKLLCDGQSVHFRAFSLCQYEKAMKLYLRSIEDRDIHFGYLKNVLSIVSFDVAAIDTAVNERLQKADGDTSSLQNKAATALILLARQKQIRYFSGDSWIWLADHGAQVQPILADLSGLTIPQKYMHALSDRIDHFAFSLDQLKSDEIQSLDSSSQSMSLNDAAQVLRDLGELGIHLDEIGDMLVEQNS
jgi:hypothetical protein